MFTGGQYLNSGSSPKRSDEYKSSPLHMRVSSLALGLEFEFLDSGVWLWLSLDLGNRKRGNMACFFNSVMFFPFSKTKTNYKTNAIYTPSLAYFLHAEQ